MKILAVDDSPTMLEILSTTLAEAGHSVVEAGNGAEALRQLGGDVDLIISDLNMVVMSGLEFLRNVRENPEHMAMPFVFLTTETDAELKRAARSGGATAWISKPFEPLALVKLVSQLAP
jgi:two-component system, chemotaxis family, chemotaxis protein CheY